MSAIKTMTPKEQIERLRAAEFATTMRVLGAYPEDRIDLRPAAKSRTARELITTFITEEYICWTALRGEHPYSGIPTTWPAGLEELLRLLDQIHHRGQFSVYLRIVDAKVPSIYGPTADDPPQS